jgi:hypothetical protein
MGFKKIRHQKKIFKAPIKTYLRDKKNYFPCAGAVFWAFYAIFKSCDL